MYNGPAASRSPEQTSTSPSQYAAGRDSYTPQGASVPRPYLSSRGQQPPSPSVGVVSAINNVRPLSRERPISTFYDPTSENRERRPGWQAPPYPHRSPIMVSRSVSLTSRVYYSVSFTDSSPNSKRNTLTPILLHVLSVGPLTRDSFRHHQAIEHIHLRS